MFEWVAIALTDVWTLSVRILYYLLLFSCLVIVTGFLADLLSDS